MADSSKSRVRGAAGPRKLPDGDRTGTEHASVHVITHRFLMLGPPAAP